MTGLIGQKIDRYEILEMIGIGGMATVYKAFDTRLDREVAIKFIKREAFPPDQLDMILKRFEREAKSLGRLSHPNIVSVIDYGEFDGSPYLVMTYLPGGTLKQKLGEPIPWREAVQLILPIAHALKYVHDHNIINRDVKPSNILLTESGQTMLTDFGLVKLFEGKDEQQLTTSGEGIGTPAYMAPEQWTGEATALSDMYSLGVVLYEMITGRRPYVSDTPAGVFLKQFNEPLPLPNQYIPDLPKNIESVLLKVLARRQEDRYPNMNAFVNELQNILEGGEASATAVGTEKLREQMTGKVKKEEVEQVRKQIEKIQKEKAQPPPHNLQPAKQKRILPVALTVSGTFVLLIILCGGCWLAYSLEALTIKTPTATATVTPLPVASPTITPTLVIFPQQWDGFYKQTGVNTVPIVGSVPISVIIEEMNGQAFSGKMIWIKTANSKGATTIISGEFVTDFGNAEEQAKWNKNPDFQSGDRSGTWIKWTETGFAQGSGYVLGGWYYGHIGSDGTMTGIYFLNDKISSLTTDSWKIKLVK